MHIKDDFGSGGPISKVSAAWFNGVAKFINGFIPGPGISFEKKNDGSATVVSVDMTAAAASAKYTTPTATNGTSIDPDDLGALTYRNLSDWKAPDDMTGLDNTTPAGWERGKTAYKNGVAVDSTHPPVGCSITVCTHACMRTVSGTTKHELLFARMEFDENGLLVRVVPVPNWYTLM